MEQRHLPSDLSRVPHFRACSCCWTKRVAWGDLRVLQLSRKSLGCFSSPDSSTFFTPSLEVEADNPSPDHYSPQAYHPLSKQDTVLPLGPGPRRSSLFQEVGDVEAPGPRLWKPPSHWSSQQYQLPNNSGGPGGSGLCQVTALPLAGVDGVGRHPSGYGEQGSKMGEGPAQSWLGFRQETEPLEVTG